MRLVVRLILPLPDHKMARCEAEVIIYNFLMDHFWLKRILSTQIVDLLWKKLKICRNRKSTRFLSRKSMAITHAQHTQSYTAKMAILLATRGCKPDVKTPKTNGATQQNVSRVSWAWNPSQRGRWREWTRAIANYSAHRRHTYAQSAPNESWHSKLHNEHNHNAVLPVLRK